MEQVTGLVRWRESVQYMKTQGVDALVECGAGKVLSGLVKRIDKEMTGTGAQHAGRHRSLPEDGLRRTRMFDLTGKAALVTGASGGIGGAIARALHEQGATVTLSGTRAEALEQLKAALGERAHVVAAKMDDAADIERLAKEAEAAMGKLDILVNNAGITRDNISMRMKDEEWEKVLQVNLTGTFRLTRAAMRGMMRRRHRPGDQHHLDRRRHRQSRPGQLCRRQGRADRHVEVAGPGARLALHHRELRRAGLHRHADDRRADRRAEEGHPRPRAGRPAGHAGGDRRRRRLSGQRRGGLRHRPDPPHQWRHGDDLRRTATSA